MRRVLGKEPDLADYMPVGAAPYYLQYHYVVTNPHPPARRKLLKATLAMASAYSPVARASTDARRRRNGRLLQLHDRRDSKSGRL